MSGTTYIDKTKNTHTLIIADSTSMPEIKSESIHLVVTSPPYWNLKKYGEEGLGPNQAYAKYLYEIQSVLKEIKRVMAPGRFVAINVGTAGLFCNGKSDSIRMIWIFLLIRYCWNSLVSI